MNLSSNCVQIADCSHNNASYRIQCVKPNANPSRFEGIWKAVQGNNTESLSDSLRPTKRCRNLLKRKRGASEDPLAAMPGHNIYESGGPLPDIDGQTYEWTFRRQYKGKNPSEHNLVGSATWKGRWWVFKIPRLPGYQSGWTRSISDTLASHLRGVKHFSRVSRVYKMALRVDSSGMVSPEWASGEKRHRWRFSDVAIMKMIKGIGLVDLLNSKDDRVLASTTFQVLAALHSSRHLGFTHYDLHAGNVMCKEESGPTVYLYDTTGPPMAVVGCGYRIVIIDYEFSHVDGLDGFTFDGRLDLLCRGYDPSRHDPCYDSLRFVISTLGYYGEKHDDDKMVAVAHQLKRSVNSSGEWKLLHEGYFEPTRELLREEVIRDLCGVKMSNQLRMFIATRFYHVIGLLTHRLVLPLTARVTTVSTLPVCKVFRLLTSCVCHMGPDHLLAVLKEIVDDRPEESIVRTLESANIQLDRPYEWIEDMRRAVAESLAHLETVVFLASGEIRKKREEQSTENHLPHNMVEFLSQRLPQRDPITTEHTVHWMKKNTRQKVQLTRATPAVLQKINDEKDFFAKSRALHDLVVSLTAMFQG